jgi:hypothetical protein
MIAAACNARLSTTCSQCVEVTLFRPVSRSWWVVTPRIGSRQACRHRGSAAPHRDPRQQATCRLFCRRSCALDPGMVVDVHGSDVAQTTWRRRPLGHAVALAVCPRIVASLKYALRPRAEASTGSSLVEIMTSGSVNVTSIGSGSRRGPAQRQHPVTAKRTADRGADDDVW